MKKIKILSFASLPLAMALLAGCGHEHTYSNEWTTSAEKHWHDATCEHKDQRKDEGPHVDDDKNNKCDVCGYEMGTPTPTPTGGEVSADEWVAAFGLSKPFYLADNYKLTMSILMGNNPQNGYVIADGSKLKAGQVDGSENDSVYNEIANGKKYQYDYNSSTEKWVKTEVRETAADDIAEFFLPFGQNYKSFTFDAQSKSYKCASLTFEGTPISDLEIKFENKQIKELSSKAPYGDGGGVMSVAVSVVYGGQVVELPQAEEHTHSYVDKSDEFGHWKECSCGEQEPGSMGAHYDANWDLKCDVCGYDMPVEVEPGYYIHYVNGSDGYASLEEISGKYVMDSFWFDADLQFAIYQVTSTEYKAFSLLTLSEDDDTKNSGISLSDGVVTINEPGSKTLTFDPAGNEGKGVLSAKKDEGPLPSEPVYGYSYNNGEYQQMSYNDKENEWQLVDFHMNTNETLKFADILNPEMPIEITYLEDNGNLQGFTNENGILTAGSENYYVFTLTFGGDNAFITIGIGQEPTPETNVYLKGSFDEWGSGYPMYLNSGSETEYLITGFYVKAGDTFKVKEGAEDSGYCNTWKTGGENNALDLGYIIIDDQNNAKAIIDLQVNVYYETSSVDGKVFGAFVEFIQAVSPYSASGTYMSQTEYLKMHFDKIENGYAQYIVTIPEGYVNNYFVYAINNADGVMDVDVESVDEGANFEKQSDNTFKYKGSADTLNLYLKVYLDGSGYGLYVANAAEPVTYNTLYLAPGVWDNDNPSYYAYFFDSTGTNTEQWIMLEKEDGLYKVDKIEGYDKVIFLRCDPTMNPLTDGWSAVWNQTDDLDIPTDANVKCTITGWGEGYGAKSTVFWGTK